MSGPSKQEPSGWRRNAASGTSALQGREDVREAVRTLARVVEELVNQSGALTCGITALIERQRDIRSVHDALDYAGPTPALPEVPQTAQEIARREIQRIEGGYYGISTAPDILVALHSIAGMEP